MGRWSDAVRTTIGIAALGVISASLFGVAVAAEWTEPIAPPPAGNPPGFVWSRAPSEAPQTGGQFHIAGSGKLGGLIEALAGAVLGSPALDLGAAGGGQNILYGVAKRSGMHADDALLLLQTADDATPPAMRDRLRLDRDGNVSVSGDLAAGACAGPIVRGVTPDATTGAAGGYTGANARCAAAFPESHLCSVEEVLRSVSCGAFGRPGVSVGAGSFWIAAGPPGFTAPANDCSGWTSDLGSQFGPFWFSDATGGRGFLSPCGISYPLSCCR